MDKYILQVDTQVGGAQFDYLPYGTCGETDFREIGRNSPQADDVPSNDGGFVDPDGIQKSEISLMGEVEDKVNSMETSAQVAEDSEEMGALENNNYVHEATTASEKLYMDEHQSPQAENREEPNEEGLAISASFANSQETVVIVDSQDVDDEMQGRSDPEPENLGLSQQSPTRSPHRGAASNVSESAQESRAITMGDLGEATELAEDEPNTDHGEMAAPLEGEPDAKRRRITAQLEEEGHPTGSISDLHL